MTSKEFRLLLVLAAARPVSMNALQIKLAGGYWFLPWGLMPGMVQKGWLTTNRALPNSDGIPSPTYYSLSTAGRTALMNEIDRRIH